MNTDNIFSLTASQESIYFDQIIKPGSPCYNVGGFCVFDKIDPGVLQQSLDILVSRYDILSARFFFKGDELVQQFDHYQTLPMTVSDFSDLPDAEGAVRHAMGQQLEQVFDLGEDRLVEACLYRVSAEKYFFFTRMHHIVSDGFGMSVYANQIMPVYQQLEKGQLSSECDSIGHFRDVIVGDQAYLKSKKYETDAAYWQNKFQYLSEPMLLPKLGSQGKTSNELSHQVTFKIADSLRQSLHALGKGMGGGLNHLGLAALLLYFSRISQRDDVVVATPIHRRRTRAQRNAVGMFTADLPGRFDLACVQTCEDLFDVIAKEQRKNLRHQSYPLHHLMRKLNLAGQGREFLTEVVFNYIPFTFKTEAHTISTNAERDPLHVRITEYSEGQPLVLDIYCRDEYMDKEDAQLFGERYIHILEQMAKMDGRSRLDDIQMLTPSEKTQLLSQFNDTYKPDFLQCSWPELFAAQVAKSPNAIAAQQEDRFLSYEALDTKSNRLAHALQLNKIGSGSLVGLLDHRGFDLLVMQVAVIKSGAAWVPLDPSHPSGRWLDILAISEPDLLIVGDTLELEQRFFKRKWQKLKVMNLDELCQQSDDKTALDNYPAMQDLAYVIFTSGSTGKPKGVMIEHLGLINNMLAKFEPLGLSPEDVIAQTASQCFDISIWQNLTALLLGAKVDIVPEEVCRDPQALLVHLNKQKITIWEPVPSMMQAALAYNQAMPTLRWVLPTGEALTPALVSNWFQRYPNIPLINAYGPAECADDVALQPIKYAVDRVLIGSPVANVRLHVVDARLSLVPIGVVGELAVSGPVVGRGYLGLPEQTQTVFIENPYAQDEQDTRLYLTGDLARRLVDGRLEYISRKDHQLKIRGYRIEPGEIEAQLLHHPAIVETVVEAREDKQGELQLVAYVVSSEHDRASAKTSQIRDFLKARLPLYMVPQAIVLLESLPLTANGKVDRLALPEPIFSSLTEYLAPQTDTQTQLVQIWQQLLDYEPIGIKDNFFDIGGHSLLASRMLSEIRDLWQAELSIKTVFEVADLAELATKIEQAGIASLPVISPTPAGLVLPLSFAQQRLWFIDQLELNATEYNMAAAFQMDGELNVPFLAQALSHIIKRHQVLHTVYKETEGQVELVRLANVKFSLPQRSLTEFNVDEQQRELVKEARQQVLTPFDLSSDLMLKVKLLKLTSKQHVLLITLHHIASDGWSKSILIDELSALYTAFLNGQENPLQPLEVQYTDYAYWQRNWLTDTRMQEQLNYWKEQLKGLPLVHSLPLDKPRPVTQSHEGGMLSLALPITASQAVEQLVKSQNVTLFMLLNTALAVLLHRYSGEDDIVIGTPIANRDQPQVAPLVGFFVNTLLLRSNLSGDPSFTQLLSQSKSHVLDAFSHSQLPFDVLVDALEPERSLSYNPLFQVMLALQNNEEKTVTLPQLSLSELPQENLRSQFDLSVEVQQTQDTLIFNWTWASDLFEHASIASMAAHFNQLLHSIASNPEQKISAMSLLTDSERQASLLSWTDDLQDFSSQECIHQKFEQQASQQPDAVAITFESEQLSYDELNRRANTLAHYLIEHGVGPDVLVGLSVERSPAMLIGLLSILKAGGAYLPLDPSYPKQRLVHMLEDSGINLVLSQHQLADSLPLNGQLVIDIEDPMLASSYSNENPVCRAQVDNLAYVIYTSGSTGKPKGVMVEHQQVTRLFSASEADFHFDSSDVWTLFHSYAFDFSVWEIWGALLHGGRLVIVPQWLARSTPDFYQLLHQENVTILNQTPTAFGHLISVDSEQQEPLALRCVIFGGEALNLAALAPWVANHGDQKPQLINMYGITETTVHVTYRQILKQDIDLRGNASMIGKPLRDLALYLLTPSLDVVPIGVPGEMYVGGAGVTRGYLNRETLTSERFISSPFIDGERLYRTGDLARYRQDGELEYLGRCDQQVKVRGFRIELGEIESSLLNQSGVTEAVVVARDEPKRLVAYTVMSTIQEEPSAQISKLRAALAQCLPEYMVPSAFVLLDKLPVTANGKTDRNALPIPAVSEQLGDKFVAPENELEHALCDVWQSHLALKSISVMDNFFHLGGDSIRAISLVAASKKVGLDYSVRDLFTFPNIRRLAQAIADQDTHSTEQQLVTAFSLLNDVEKSWLAAHPNKGMISDAYPQSTLQQGMILHNLLGAEAGTYHDIFGYHFKASWQPALFAQALDALVAEQDSFRTMFCSELERPLLLVFNNLNMPLEFNDLRHLSDEEQVSAIEQWAETRKQTEFDFTKPVWRAAVHQLKDDEIYYHLSFHHALWDGWSVASLNTRLFNFYIRLLRGQALPERQKTLSYSQFVALEQSFLQNNDAKTYWQEKLEGAQLPWWASTEQTSSRLLTYEFTSHHNEQLQALARQLNVQDKSVLLAIHVALLSLISGNADVTTSVVTNGRPEIEGGEKTLGLFLNSLPLRIRNIHQSWSSLICELNDELMTLMTHRQYPLSEVQNITGMEYSASLFNYIDFHIYKDLGDDIEVLAVDDFEQTNYLFDANYTRDPLSNKLELSISLDTAHFDENFVERIHGYINNIVTALVELPQGRIDALRHLGPKEVNTALVDWNKTSAPELMSHSWPELFSRQVLQSPDTVVAVCADQRLTYTELDERSNILAKVLRHRGTVTGDIVALLDHRGLDLLVTIVAVLKVGAAYMPLDPEQPSARWLKILDESNVGLLILGSELTLEKRWLSRKWKKESIQSYSELLAMEQGDQSALSWPAMHDLAYVLFTSGSTGTPKGVMVEHKGMINNMLAKVVPLSLGQSDIIAQTASQCFDISVWQFLTAPLLGAIVDIVPTDITKDPKGLLTYLQSHQITHWEPVPSVMRAAMYYQIDLPVLRWVLPTGEALTSDLVEQWFKQYPTIPLMNAYGPAECSDDVAFQAIVGPVDRVLIGKPVANARLHVLTPDLALAPVGVVGQLAVSGPVVGRGYLGQPEKTDEVFIDNPWPQDEQDSRLYLTGDLVRRYSDGSLEYVGRKDFQVKVRGYRIELGEIESQLNHHDAVSEAVVVAKLRDDGEYQLVAYVVTETDQSELEGTSSSFIDASQLKDYLSQHLPHYMVPAGIVLLSTMPLSPNGKLDRSALPEPVFGDDGEYEPPISETEKTLAQIWQTLLDRDEVGRNDNFFNIGGHSLLVARLITQIGAQWQIDLSIKSVFEARTLAETASLIDDANKLHQLDTNIDLDSLPEEEIDRYLELLAAEEAEA